MFSRKLWMVVPFAAMMAGCATSRNESKGFHLSDNGDLRRGKAAFLEFQCNTCHEVRGANLPRPTIQRVALGGSVVAEPSDGYIVTAIINPAYHAALYPMASDPTSPPPRMPEFASRMSVQQLTDIVVYLKSRYTLAPTPVPNEFP